MRATMSMKPQAAGRPDAQGAPMEGFLRAGAALAASGNPAWTPSSPSPRSTASNCSAPYLP
jgi:hypothetical protein